MPYDSYLWGESKQSSGLVVLAGKGPTPLVSSGNTNILRKGFGTPILVGLGQSSLTKPGGCAIAGNRSYGTNKFCGPGHIGFGHGIGFMTNVAVPYQEGETLTGYTDTTNVAEYTILQADFTYGSAHKYPGSAWDAMAAAGGGELWSVPTSVTAAAIVTPAVIGTLDGMTTDTGDMWLDTRAKYHILGYIGCVGIASSSGTITFTGLGAKWNGYVPGIPETGKDVVQLGVLGMSYCYEPIPFDGDALPSYMCNCLDDTAHLGAILLAKHK